MIVHVARGVAIYDCARMHVMYCRLADIQQELEQALAKMDGSEWPPPGLSGEAINVGSGFEDDGAMDVFAKQLVQFCTTSCTKASSLSESVQVAVQTLEYEARRFQDHSVMRKLLWLETVLVSELLRTTWQPGADAVKDMYKDLADGKPGFLAKILEISALRPVEGKYRDSKALPIGVEIFVQDLESGLAPHCDADCFKGWSLQ
jgi:hypothetical protein